MKRVFRGGLCGQRAPGFSNLPAFRAVEAVSLLKGPWETCASDSTSEEAV